MPLAAKMFYCQFGPWRYNDYKHVTPLGSFIFAILLWGHMYLNIASGGNNFSNKHFSPIAKVAHQKEAI
jgi:hypothetical protein